MKTFDWKTEYKNPIVLSLGFFDCIHIGHKSLICTANKIADEIGAESFVMTFSNDPSVLFYKSKQLYTFENRLEVLENIGVQGVISAEFDDDFAAMQPDEFLKTLFGTHNVKCIVVGADYTFGINAEGDVEYLKKYCAVKGIRVEIVPFACINGLKLSTRNLKGFVETGDLRTLNAYLSEPYFMRGKVVSAKHNGTRMGFPTANILQSDERFPLGNGVYATKVVINGIEYAAMTNVGGKPTFNDFSETVETHIMGFDGDLYGKDIKIIFIERIRDIKTYKSMDDLRVQLTKDEQHVKTLFGLSN